MYKIFDTHTTVSTLSTEDGPKKQKMDLKTDLPRIVNHTQSEAISKVLKIIPIENLWP